MPAAYFPLDVNFFDHPKVVPLGDLALRMHLSAIGYANRLMTDGFIAAPIPGRLVEWDHYDTDAPTPESCVGELVRAVLWHAADEPCPRGHDETCPKLAGEGWRVHDFLEHNRSKDERQKAHEAERDRKAAWRERQRQAKQQPRLSAVPPSSPETDVSRGTPASRGRPGDGEYRDRDRDKVSTHPESLRPPLAVVHKGSVENLSQSSQRRAKLRDPIGVGDALAPITGQKPSRPTRDQLRWREEADKRAAAARIDREATP